MHYRSRSGQVGIDEQMPVSARYWNKDGRLSSTLDLCETFNGLASVRCHHISFHSVRYQCTHLLVRRKPIRGKAHFSDIL
jgi:hypothetical protein